MELRDELGGGVASVISSPQPSPCCGWQTTIMSVHTPTPCPPSPTLVSRGPPTMLCACMHACPPPRRPSTPAPSTDRQPLHAHITACREKPLLAEDSIRCTCTPPVKLSTHTRHASHHPTPPAAHWMPTRLRVRLLLLLQLLLLLPSQQAATAAAAAAAAAVAGCCCFLC